MQTIGLGRQERVAGIAKLMVAEYTWKILLGLGFIIVKGFFRLVGIQGISNTVVMAV
jgi:hypothetical protein